MPDGTSTAILIVLDTGDAPDAGPFQDFVGITTPSLWRPTTGSPRA